MDAETVHPDRLVGGLTTVVAASRGVAGGELDRSSERTLLLVATYDERENLPPLIERVLIAADVDILVVDDGSPDGTGAVADEIAARESRVRVVHRDGKQGVASAHVLAFRIALTEGYESVVEMDADFSHLPEDVPRLIAASQDFDIVLGSRSVRGGRVVGRTPLRNLLTRAGCAYARMVLRLPVRDCTGGFRCTRLSALRTLDLERVTSHGYGFQLELNHAWALAGMRFREEPIVFHDRVVGRSKMTTGILLEALVVVMRLRLGSIRPAVLRHGPQGRAVVA